MKKIYEIFMLILILASVALLWVDFRYAMMVDLSIWVVFVVDYTIRFAKAAQKKQFVRSTIFELIALIPLDTLFRSFRIVRIFRVFRLGVYLSRYAKPLVNVLYTNQLYKMLTFTTLLILGGAIGIYYLEPNMQSFHDALWWSIVTATTVGYGDISPETGLGRVIAVILMLTGIGTLGMVTGSIATYFLTEKEKTVPKPVRYIQEELERFDELSVKDMKILSKYMASLIELKEEEEKQKNTHPPDHA